MFGCPSAYSLGFIHQEVIAPVARTDGDHYLTTVDPVVVLVPPGRGDPRTTSISGKGFDECTAGTQVGRRRARAFSESNQ